MCLMVLAWAMNVSLHTHLIAIRLLESEIEALEKINQELYGELDDANVEKERLVRAKTLKGQYYNLMGYILSVYCVWKIVMVVQ